MLTVALVTHVINKAFVSQAIFDAEAILFLLWSSIIAFLFNS